MSPENFPPTDVIDLREGPSTRVRIADRQNPLLDLPPDQRMRLIVRVLCELVAYGELQTPPGSLDHPRSATAG